MRRNLEGELPGLLVWVALAAAGCASDTTQDDCGAGCAAAQVCARGACVARRCSDGAPCPDGLVCGEDSVCRVEAPACVEDADCGDRARCVDGACFASECEEGEKRPCENACEVGQKVCRGGVFRACSARQPLADEVCGDDRDDDCDGLLDEGCVGCELGAERRCQTACGEGVETCVDDAWQGCDAPQPADMERCGDGGDDDCDGEIDEGCPDCADGQTRACDSMCGAGEQRCAGGAWDACDAPQPVDGACVVECTNEARFDRAPLQAMPAAGTRAWFPRAAWTGLEFGVLWNERRDNQGLTVLSRVSALGAVQGQPSVLAMRNAGDFAWLGEHYLVVTIEVGRLTVARVSGFGRVIEETPIEDVSSALDVRLAAGGVGAGLLWSQNLEDLYFMPLDADGKQAGPARRLTNAPGRSMDATLVADGDGFALAFWDERDNPDDPFNPHVYGLRVDARGAKRAPEARIDSGRAPALLALPGGGFGLAYQRSGELADQVVYRQLDAGLRPTGEAVDLSQSARNARRPALAQHGGVLTAVWEDFRHEGTELYLARLTPAGALEEGPIRLTEAGASAMPALAVDPQGGHLLAWSDRRDVPDPDNQARPWFAAGPLTCEAAP